MKIETSLIRIPEDKIDADLQHQLTALTRECFSRETDSGAYFKQMPHFRYVIYADNAPVAQVGIDHRLMNFDGVPKRIYGLVSVCVAPNHRGGGLASQLLDAVLKDAMAANIDYILLLADNPALYKKHGYRFIDAQCTWLGIDDKKYTSVGLLVEDIKSELMIKGVLKDSKNYRKIDFLGYMF